MPTRPRPTRPRALPPERDARADRLLLTPVPEHAREVGLGLGRPLGVADGEKGIARLLEGGLLTRFVVCPVERERSPEQQLGALRIVVGPKGERIVVLGGGDREAVEGERAISRGSQRSRVRSAMLVVVPTRRADELERRAPVVREHLRVVLRRDRGRRSTPRRRDAVCARSARGIWPYDTSRTSACANANSLSPSSDERRWRRTKPLRSSEWSDAVAASGSRPIELAQNTFPTTAASWSRLFSASGRPSRRAAMMPWSVSGSGSSSVEPCST